MLKKLLLALLFSLMIVVPAQAIELLLLPADATWKGELISDPVAIPEGVSGVTLAELILTLSDLQNPATKLDFRLETSSDGGVTWSAMYGATYQGGVYPPGPGGQIAGNPGFGFYTQYLAGKQVRFRIITETRLNISARLRF